MADATTTPQLPAVAPTAMPAATPPVGPDLSASNVKPTGNPYADLLNHRLTLLDQNGHSWMDSVMQTQLATGAGSDQTMLATADTMKHAADAAGVSPSAAIPHQLQWNTPPIMKAVSWIHSLYSQPPGTTSDITATQNNLIAKGYGKGLTPGAWSTEWNNAANQYYLDQLSKPGFGNAATGKLVSLVLKEVMPATFAHQFVKWFEAAPSELFRYYLDAASNPLGVVGYGTMGPATKGLGQASANIQTSVASAAANLGKAVPQLASVTQGFQPVTEQQLVQQKGARSFNDALNALQYLSTMHSAADLLHGAGSMIEALTPAAKDASLAEKLAAISKATVKDPKVMLGKSLPESYANAARSTVVKTMYQAGAQTGKGAGIFNFLNKIPVGAKTILPAFDRTISKDGSQYLIFKNKVGQWARNPIRQSVAQLNNAGMGWGLKTLAISEAQDKFDQKDPTKPVDLAHVTPYSGVTGWGLNTLSMLAGAPTEAVRLTQNAKSAINAVTQVHDEALGATGVDWALKTGTGVSLNQLKAGLGDTIAQHWINGQINEFAAIHWAEEMAKADTSLDPADTHAYTDYVMKMAEQAKQDPQIMDKARNSLVANKQTLATYFKSSLNDYTDRRVLRNADGPFVAGKEGKQKLIAGIKEWYSNFDKKTELMSEENRHQFYASNLQARAEDARTEAITRHFGETTPKFDPRNEASPRLFAISNKVDELAPDSGKLTRRTPYGSGVRATDNQRWAGRTPSNVYSLQHVASDERPVTFYDMDARGQTTAITKTMRKLIGGNQGRTIEQNALRNEMLLNGARTPEYNKLLKMLKDDFNYTPKEIADQYREALKVAGNLKEPQVNSRVADLVNQVVRENDHTGFKYTDFGTKDTNGYGLQHIIDPNRITAIRAHIPVSLEKDNFLASNQVRNFVGRGQLGIAKADTLRGDQVRDQVNKYFNILAMNGRKDDVDAAQAQLQLESKTDTVGKQLPRMSGFMTPDETDLWNKIFDTLAMPMNLDPKETQRLADPIQLLSQVYRSSKNLPVEAKLLPTASPELVKLVDELKANGEVPVLGTGIGHSFEAPLIHPLVVQNSTRMARKVSNALGLGLDPTKDENTATWRNGLRANAIDKAALTGRYKSETNPSGHLPFNYTGSDVVHMLQQGAKNFGLDSSNVLNNTARNLGKLVKTSAPGLTEGKKFVALGKGTPAIDKLFNELYDIHAASPEEITAAKREFAASQSAYRDSEFGLNDLTFDQGVKILTQPLNKDAVTGDRFTEPLFDKKTAQLIMQDIAKANAKMPFSMVGLGSVDDFIRASGAIAAHGTASFLGSSGAFKSDPKNWGLWNPISAAGPAFLNLRNRFRWDLNPKFGIERMLKTNVKAAVEGIPASANPYLALVRLGKDSEARSILRQAMPDYSTALNGFGDLDKTLAASDIFNFYNPLHNMMWQAYHLKEQGLSMDEIAQKLEKINTYGDRTAFEKSLSTVFYPFSFNKTLYRNLGGYLLDNQNKSMLTNVGLELWNHYQHGNNDLGKWMDQHFPLIQQLKSMNAFDHGVGLGQLGGINAQYVGDTQKFLAFMNMFGPQAVTPTSAPNMNTLLKQLIPAWSELNGILWGRNPQSGQSRFGYGTLPETLRSGLYELMNRAEHVGNVVAQQHRSLTDYTETMDATAQQQAGMDFVTSAKSILAPNIAAGMTWDQIPNAPADLAAPDANGNPQKVNSTTIQTWAHELYPAYIPGGSVTAALAKQTAAKDFMRSMRNDKTFGAAYSYFYQQANSAISIINKSSDMSVIAQEGDKIRQMAVTMAEYDPRFLSFYKKFFASALGPIEEIK